MCSFIQADGGPLGCSWYAYNTHWPAKKAVFGLIVEVFQGLVLFKEQVKK
jgi:hypothetical protein